MVENTCGHYAKQLFPELAQVVRRRTQLHDKITFVGRGFFSGLTEYCRLSRTFTADHQTTCCAHRPGKLSRSNEISAQFFDFIFRCRSAEIDFLQQRSRCRDLQMTALLVSDQDLSAVFFNRARHLDLGSTCVNKISVIYRGRKVLILLDQRLNSATMR